MADATAAGVELPPMDPAGEQLCLWLPLDVLNSVVAAFSESTEHLNAALAQEQSAIMAEAEAIYKRTRSSSVKSTPSSGVSEKLSRSDSNASVSVVVSPGTAQYLVSPPDSTVEGNHGTSNWNIRDCRCFYRFWWRRDTLCIPARDF